jgi:predicted extracellular nuclease
VNIPNKYFGLLVFGILIISALQAQVSEQTSNSQTSYRVVFYNLENFFDTQTDSTRDYNEFTPEGALHWTDKKYQEKRTHIFQVLTAIAEWQPITLMGFVEIENAFVLQDLINSTPLGRENYDVVHFESNDRRGIDVGLIYHADHFKLLSSQKIPVKDPGDPDFTTRDILYVKGLLAGDTLHVFINHWVSRWRGVMESQYLRVLCAESLKKVIDSVCVTNPDANILVMGDFNDNPDDKSILRLTENTVNCQLHNVNLTTSNKNVKGTLKYGSEWSYFDQFLISTALLAGKSSSWLKAGNGHVFDASFLLEEDKKYLGVKLKRTYTGYKYNGGFSDHLPIFVDIYTSKTK